MNELKGKKIAVVGFGREGQALAAYFYANHIEADYFDQKESALSGAEVLGRLIVGPHNAGELSQYDLVFRSPGLSPHNPLFSAIKGRLTSLTEQFMTLWPGRIVGVTGTKGKGTTASLIEAIGRAAGKKVLLVGNIGYVDLLSIDGYNADSIAIMEMSSFQLMNLGLSPHIAVILDITSDHLDYHHDVKEYITAKLEIVSHQKKTDWAVVTDANPRFESIKKAVKSQLVAVGQAKTLTANGVWWIDDDLMKRAGSEVTKLLSVKDVSIAGKHNRINIAAACAVALCLDIKLADIQRGVADFKGLPQRLETIATCRGITFINDSASTNPVTAIAALDSMTAPTLLLVGGRNKGLDYRILVDAIIGHKKLKRVIAYGECGPEIAELLRRKKYQQFELVTGFFGAMQQALDIARSGDTVLLSPAAASFDEFNNSVERGKKFNQSVHEYCHRKF